MSSIQSVTIARVRRLKWAGTAAIAIALQARSPVPAHARRRARRSRGILEHLVRSEVDGATTLYRGGEMSHESEHYRQFATRGHSPQAEAGFRP